MEIFKKIKVIRDKHGNAELDYINKKYLKCLMDQKRDLKNKIAEYERQLDDSYYMVQFKTDQKETTGQYLKETIKTNEERYKEIDDEIKSIIKLFYKGEL